MQKDLERLLSGAFRDVRPGRVSETQDEDELETPLHFPAALLHHQRNVF